MRPGARLMTAALAGGTLLGAGAATAPAGAQVAPGAAAAGRLEAGTFGDGAARREYRLFVPASHDRARPAPLVVFLHGCTQDGDDAARGTRLDEAAARDGFLVLYPSQPATANGLKCWNWFEPAHQRRGAGEPAALAAMTRAVAATHGVDPRRVHVAGISAGGAMAMIVGAAYPELYASVASHAGVPIGAAAGQGEALAAMRGAADPARLALGLRETLGGGAPRPLLVLHGGADAVVSPAIAMAAAATWAGAAGAAAGLPATLAAHGPDARPARYTRFARPDGRIAVELVVVEGLGHAWPGGSSAGTYVDPRGPSAADLVAAFFARHPMPAEGR